MRFLSGGPIIPDALLRDRDAGRVVFVCGAGVSSPAGMPTFVELTTLVIGDISPPQDSEIIRALQNWLSDDDGIPVEARTPLDQIFNMLQNEYGRDAIGKLVTKHLTVDDPNTVRTIEHEIIAKISSNQTGNPQIVTTNFDHLFEHISGGIRLPLYQPPTFPDLLHDVPIMGITYLHGRLPDRDGTSHDYVLSSADFGRAYLAQGWATSFVRLLLNKYTVVLLGYQAEDPPVKYLLQGLNAVQAEGRRQLYAFDQGQPEEIETKWQDRGVTPIAYGDDHRVLWDSLEGWAARSADTGAWRSSIVEMAQRGPTVLQPHERGMVCHLVQTTAGVKLFAEASPSPPAEWLCVFDPNCRFEKATFRQATGEESFYPTETYGLDDDPSWRRDNFGVRSGGPEDLISWRSGDESPEAAHGLIRIFPEGHDPLPARLFHLTRWIVVHVDDPVLAWWVTRQIRLHPRLLAMLAGAVDESETLPASARQLWQILLEWLSRPRDHADTQWFRVRRNIRRHGWLSALPRQFQEATEPVFKVGPPVGLARARPPPSGWQDSQWDQIAHVDVEFIDFRNDRLDIPDDVLPAAFAALQWNLIRGVQRLNECRGRWYHIVTLYPDASDDTDDDIVFSSDAYIAYFVSLLDRMAETNSSALRGYVATWPSSEPNIFDKLHLYTLNKPMLFSADEAADHILALNNAAFWNTAHRREMLFLLRDRWSGFSVDARSQIAARLLEGRERHPHGDEDEHEIRRKTESAIVIGWLIGEGCKMNEKSLEEWTALKQGLPQWQDDWAESAAHALRGKSGWIATDEDESALEDIPVSEITARALAQTKHAAGEFTEYQPFRGLIKNQPSRAIAALGAASRGGEFPAGLWGDAISNWPQGAAAKANFLFHERMRRLPPETIVQVRYEVGRWLEGPWVLLAEENESYALELFDDLVSGLLSGGEQGTDSGLGEVYIGGGPVEKSRRTLDHAINGPIGSATRALLSALAKREPAQGTGMPHEFSSHFAPLLAAPEKGSDHATCILAERANWLDYIAADWADETIIPWFGIGHEKSEPAWNGLLHNGKMPTASLFGKVRDDFIELFPAIYSWNWGDHAEERAHQWVVLATVFFSNGVSGISFDQARDCIRNMNSRGRGQVIQFLGRVGEENKFGWKKYTIPFIEKAWPKEKSIQTEETSKAWISVLEGSGERFPALVDAIGPYLRRTGLLRFGLYGFTRVDESKEMIPRAYPDHMLDVLDLVIPDSPADVPHDLAAVLQMLTEAKPAIVSDRRFVRLEALVASR